MKTVDILMGKTKFYHQCRLVRNLHGSRIETTSFIPEEYALVNNILKLKDADGVWTDGWVIVRLGDKVDAETVEKNERTWARARANSDI